MTRSDDFISQLESYLDEHEGSTPLPNDIRNAIRAQLPSTRQRPAWWPARRFPEMNQVMKLSLAAAVVVVAALLGYNYLVAPNIGGPRLGDPSPTAIPTPTPSPLRGQDPLSAGRYLVDPAGLPMEVTVEVPDGWSAGLSWVVRGPLGNDAPDGMAIRFYTLAPDPLYINPFVISEGVLDPAVGPSVDELVAAMVGHPDWIVIGTEPITIDGYAGQVVHVTLPEETTADNPFYLFRDAVSSGVYGWQAGQLHDIHILDVAGERLIVEAFHYPGTSAAHLAAQQTVLDSIQIESP